MKPLLGTPTRTHRIAPTLRVPTALQLYAWVLSSGSNRELFLFLEEAFFTRRTGSPDTYTPRRRTRIDTHLAHTDRAISQHARPGRVCRKPPASGRTPQAKHM